MVIAQFRYYYGVIMNNWITAIAYGFLLVTGVAWMMTMLWLGFNILDQITYLAESSDYNIQLLDNIWSELDPLGELGLLSHNRSFSCEIN